MNNILKKARPETLDLTVCIIAAVMLLTGMILGIAIPGGQPAASEVTAPVEEQTVANTDENVIENPEEFFLTSTVCGYDTPVSVFTNLLTGQTWATVYLGDKEIGRYTLLDPGTEDVYRCYNIYETCDEINDILDWNVENGVVVIPVG